MTHQDLFGAVELGPPGFRYVPDAVAPAEEQNLLAIFEDLPFEPFQFHGYTGLRRIVSFGFRYDYGARRVRGSDPLPTFLQALQAKAASLCGAGAEEMA